MLKKHFLLRSSSLCEAQVQQSDGGKNIFPWRLTVFAERSYIVLLIIGVSVDDVMFSILLSRYLGSALGGNESMTTGKGEGNLQKFAFSVYL